MSATSERTLADLQEKGWPLYMMADRQSPQLAGLCAIAAGVIGVFAFPVLALKVAALGILSGILGCAALLAGMLMMMMGGPSIYRHRLLVLVPAKDCGWMVLQSVKWSMSAHPRPADSFAPSGVFPVRAAYRVESRTGETPSKIDAHISERQVVVIDGPEIITISASYTDENTAFKRRWEIAAFLEEHSEIAPSPALRIAPASVPASPSPEAEKGFSL